MNAFCCSQQVRRVGATKPPAVFSRGIPGALHRLAVAPPMFGALIDASGYAQGWLATSAVFAIATVTILRRSRTLAIH